MDNRHIIIFDGICNFCNGAVNFIINRDPEGIFSFTPMQSDIANELIVKHNINNVGVNTFLLVKNNKCYIWTDAALEITKDLSGFWYVFNGLRIVPALLRDYLYRAFARNRYKLFGKRTSCMVPSNDVKKRFIGT